MRYPNLFAGGRIGELAIRNRIVLAPMGTGLANYDGTASEQQIAYYEERAKNGVGLVITELTRVNFKTGAAIPRHLSLTSDRHVAPFAALVDRVHEHGAKIFSQLHHPGGQNLSAMIVAGPAIEYMGRAIPGFYRALPSVFKAAGKAPRFPQVSEWMIEHQRWPAVVGPSDVPSLLFDQKVRPLRRSEIRSIIDDFVKSAKRAQLAGADGVELHATHGYLIQQFLSAHTNLRTDEYGGSLDNRMRFLLDIIAGIRHECGPGFPVAVRLTVDEFFREVGMPGEGIELEEGVEMARRLERAGVDAIDVSSAAYENSNYWLEPMSFEQGWRKHLAAAVKQVVSIPVIAVNGVRTPEQGEALLAEGTQDFVSLGRALLADPEWVTKAAEGRETEIRRCISCLWCIEALEANAQKGEPVECAVNPRTGRETGRVAPRDDGAGRTVVVVGAGPAGLSAAEILGRRGFRAILLERDSRSGGQLRLASVPPGKDKIDWCVEDLEAAALREGAEIRYGCEATPALIESLDPCTVIVATGGLPVVPRVPGVELENICTVNDVLGGAVRVEGERVAVIGAGMTGLETAEKLAADGNRVIVVEMADKLGPGVYFQNLEDVLSRLAQHDPEYMTSHRLVRIERGTITLEDIKTRARLERMVDRVVLAVGVRRDDRLASELKSYPRPVKIVGDARRPGRIAGAVRDGFDAAWDL